MSMTIKRWADMARTHISCVSKADGHLNRLGDKCDRVRLVDCHLFRFIFELIANYFC